MQSVPEQTADGAPKVSTKLVELTLGDRSHEVVIGEGLCEQVAEFVRGKADRFVILTSPKIARFHLAPLQKALEDQALEFDVLMFPDAEEFKVFKTANALMEKMAVLECDRHTMVINLGGGVVSDVGNFVAATYLRGLPSVNLPTTLLGMVDAAIGGKCGVNLPQGKNLLGAIHQPRGVFADVEYLSTLAHDEFRNGLAEVLKYGAIWDAELFRFLDKENNRVMERDPAVITKVVHRCAQIKADIVSQDEREYGVRRILNFGHTIGHALEAATEYKRLKHGFAVSIGMVAETYLAVEMELTPREVLKDLERVLDKLELPRAIDNLEVDGVLRAMRQDKKRRGDNLRFVVPLQIGEVCEIEGVALPLIERALNSVIVNFDW